MPIQPSNRRWQASATQPLRRLSPHGTSGAGRAANRPNTAATPRTHWLWVGLLALSIPALAAAPGERRLTYGGFGTLGLLYHDDEGYEYRRSISQPRGADAGEWDLETDSLAGFQINAAWNRQLEVVGQAVTRLTLDGDWQPQITRAFLRYDLGAELLQLRAGRIGWGIFPRADSRDVGYSQLTIRPPVEAFGIIPTDRFDGVEAALVRPLGTGLISVKAYGGFTRIQVAPQDREPLDRNNARLWGGHADYAHGPWVLRAGSGILQDTVNDSFPELAEALRQSGEPQALAAADRMAASDQTLLFVVAGVTYDQGPVQLRMFLSRTSIDRAIGPNVNSGLLVGGYRWQQWTPYAAFSIVDNRDDIQATGLPDSPQYAGLNAAVIGTQMVGRYNQHSVALGLRYDLTTHIALKGQIDGVSLRDSRLPYDRRMPPQSSGRMTVFGLALDFLL